MAGNGPGERRQPRETGGLEGNIVGHYPGAGERRWGLMHRRKFGLCQEQGHRSREKAECMGQGHAGSCMVMVVLGSYGRSFVFVSIFLLK